MIGGSTARQFSLALATATLLTAPMLRDASAQEKPRTQPATVSRQPAASRGVQIGGYGMFGNISFTARESFDAITGQSSGPIFGGGARVALPFGGLFVDVGAWRYRVDGERAFVANDQVFPLGIPVEITITPLELSAGWQFRLRKLPKLIPYVAGGFTSMSYQETSEFSTDAENVDDRFPGYHLYGGAEYKITRWLGVAGEANWMTVPNAIGEAGVSEAFNETNLGGTSFRFKITIGQ